MMLAISRMYSIERTKEISTLWPIPKALEFSQQLLWNLAVSFGIKILQFRITPTPIIVQWYLGIRPLWNKSNLVYILFGREKFCLVYNLCLEYDSCARTSMSQNESWQAEPKFFRQIFSKSQTWWASTRSN
jgi:hypothetical protein